MKIRRSLIWLFVLCFTVCVMVPAAFAAETVASGECGDNATWKLDSEGTFTVSGKGSTGQPVPDEYKLQVKTVVLSDGITAVDEYAFAGCSNLTDVTLGDDVESIGFFAFYNCTGLTGIVLGDDVESIDPAAFALCSSLSSVEFGDDVEYIGGDAFYRCDSLTSVTLGRHVEFLDDYAFSYCATLQEIVFTGDAPTFGEAVFAGLEAKVYYPANNETWTQGVMLDYDGDISWIAYTPTSVEITNQPKTTYTMSGEKAKATVKATGDGLTYQWYVKNAGETKYTKSSITKATYSVTMNSKSKDRLVYCIVKDKYGNKEKSETVRLRMAASITTQPKNASAEIGAKAKTTVKAAGDGLTYTWYVKDKGDQEFTKSSLKTATYSVKMSKSNSGRQVYCVVKDKYGKKVTSKTVTLGIPVKVTTQPKTTYTKSGSTAKATVKATGDGLTYQWYVKNSGATKYTKSSITKATYSVTMNSKSKDRLVYCVIKDKYGNKVQTETVRLRMAATVTTQPKNASAKIGAKAKTTVKAAGDGLTYTWYVKDKGATKFTKSSLKTATYSVKMTEANNGRQVYCVVKDKYGKKVTTKTVKLTAAKVYLNENGKKYHYDEECAGPSGYASAYSTAVKSGKTPCSKCAK